MDQPRARVRIDPIVRLREGLAIDPADLNTCLIEQPDKFWHAAEMHARATGERDKAKLDMETRAAEVGSECRTVASANSIKLTEAALEEKVRLDPTVHAANIRYIDLKTHTEVLNALREAYLQRSYMLKELVTREQRQLTMLAQEQGDAARRSSLNDALSDRVSQMRREGRRV